MKDIVIIGAGCAGLTAAVYARRLGRSVVILEGESIGGQILYAPQIENYPGIKNISGMAFSDVLYDQAMNFGAELDFAQAEKIEKAENGFIVSTDSGVAHTCRSVILATGAKHRKLGLANEEELTGHGVSYCALCDGAFFKNKDVAVVGGGSTALESVEHLSGVCHKVILIHRRNGFRGEEALAERIRSMKNVEFRLGCEVTALSGEKELSGITITDKAAEKTEKLDVSGLFVAIGQVPDNSRFADLVTLDDYGYIVAGENCQTSCPGIFAAGDCRVKNVRQLATAAADGAVCAVGACGSVL